MLIVPTLRVETPPIPLRVLQPLLAECIPSVGAGLLANAVDRLHLITLALR
jgi:hypothetical protein